MINPLRFEAAIHRIVVSTFEKKIRKTVFTRMDCFTAEVLRKYREDGLPILISLFFVDANKTSDGILFLENERGLSQQTHISELKFFKSFISIFAGCSTAKIRKYFLENPEENMSSVAIFIDSRLEEE